MLKRSTQEKSHARKFYEKVHYYLSQNEHLVNPVRIEDGITVVSDYQKASYLLIVSLYAWEVDKNLTNGSLLFDGSVRAVEFCGCFTDIHRFIKQHLAKCDIDANKGGENKKTVQESLAA